MVRLHVPAGVTHQLVRQYLLHFGYADTLRAFDSAAGVLPDDEAVPADKWVLQQPANLLLPDHRRCCGYTTMVLAACLSWCSSSGVACAVATAVAGVMCICKPPCAAFLYTAWSAQSLPFGMLRARRSMPAMCGKQSDSYRFAEIHNPLNVNLLKFERCLWAQCQVLSCQFSSRTAVCHVSYVGSQLAHD